MFQNHRRCITSVASITAIAALAVLAACSDNSSLIFGPDDPNGNGGNSGDSGDPDTPKENGGGGDGGDASDGKGGSGGDGGSGAAGCTGTDPDKDEDGDGYSRNQGDCNDCNPLVNPGAFDIPGNGIDDDCDGVIDNDVACDSDLAIHDADAENGVRAIDLCRFTDEGAIGVEKTWGVINGSARYVKADGTGGMHPIGHGLLPSFGVEKGWKGDRMLALSSGAARAPGQPSYASPSGVDHKTTSPTPDGYSKTSSFCPLVVPSKTANDPAALEVKIRVPTNANSFSFNLDFYTYEYPGYICSSYTDIYVTMMWPKAPALPDPNISFDPDGNPISVNSSLLHVCEPGTHKGITFTCDYGTNALQDTGFESKGATGWLVTQAPVVPGSIITLRFAIWDSGDHVLDSTVLLDNFQWHAEPVEAPTTTHASPPP